MLYLQRFPILKYGIPLFLTRSRRSLGIETFSVSANSFSVINFITSPNKKGHKLVDSTYLANVPIIFIVIARPPVSLVLGIDPMGMRFYLFVFRFTIFGIFCFEEVLLNPYSTSYT